MSDPRELGWRVYRGRDERIPFGQLGYVHVCGYASVEGVWRCVQDYWADGEVPASSCGAVAELDDAPFLDGDRL